MSGIAPPVPYFGGKQRIAGRIAALLPPHAHYVEPFRGGLSVLLAKPPSPMETANDLDEAIVAFWRVLRDRPGQLARVCALTPHARAEHAAALDVGSGGELERARRVWVRLTQGRGGMLRRTGWRYHVDPAGAGMGIPGYLAGYAARIAPAAARLAHVSLECRPALEVIAQYGRHPGVLLYVDPPYPGPVRRPGSTSSYRHEMKSGAEHAVLIEALLACRAAVVLSGYACGLYDSALGGWSRVEIPAASGHGTAGARSRTEVLWCNREIAQPALFAPP